MIEAGKYTSHQIRDIYSRRSRIYRNTVAPLEFSNHLRAIEKAAIRPEDKILEVAVGPGLAIAELAKHVSQTTVVEGVDISPGMLAVARETLAAAHITNVNLSESSATSLKFPDNSFDLLYNGYMLDLIPLADMPVILAEFRRVLKVGGRLVLLNMSKPNEQTTTFRERLYPMLPPELALYLIGGCRPVLMEHPVIEAGLRQVTREYLAGKFPSEIVIGIK
ncbi:MAG: class I SAM-dependent methyltransferase [Anaerolineae bacterium]|nr:class I SAM-dependent methyltransferase [Anaerolineae bacterium]